MANVVELACVISCPSSFHMHSAGTWILPLRTVPSFILATDNIFVAFRKCSNLGLQSGSQACYFLQRKGNLSHPGLLATKHLCQLGDRG